jgi:hypothetical protein
MQKEILITNTNIKTRQQYENKKISKAFLRGKSKQDAINCTF